MEGILACSTDGEKALIEGFQRNLQFAVFLRCFLHFKDNIKRELTERGITAEAKKQFSDEIFGIQDGTTKYTRLADCNSDEEFDSKLAALKANWEEREALNGSNQKKKTFFDWFLCEKVSDILQTGINAVCQDSDVFYKSSLSIILLFSKSIVVKKKYYSKFRVPCFPKTRSL